MKIEQEQGKELEAKVIPHITNEYGRLRKVLVNVTPGEVTSFTDLIVNPIQERALEKIEARGQIITYPGAAARHGKLLQILEDNGVELVYSNAIPVKPGHTPLFTRDIGVIIGDKVLPSKMRYDYRSVEVAGLLDQINDMSILDIDRDYRIEGGDVVYLEENLLLIGIGPRTDMNGLMLLRELFPEKKFVAFSTVREEEAFHIDTNMGILGHKHLVYLPELVPQEVVNFLQGRGYTFVEADPSEHDTCCTNVIAISDRVIIAPAENVITNQRLRESGVEVLEVELNEILSFGGGPHCLTLPLVRD